MFNEHHETEQRTMKHTSWPIEMLHKFSIQKTS